MKANKWSDLLLRAALGGVLGLALGAFLLDRLIPSLSVTGADARALPPLAYPLCAALGVMAGTATLPFAGEGRKLVLYSVLHFAATAALFALLIRVLDGEGLVLLVWVGLLALLYVLIWLSRLVGWYADVVQLRRGLGLDPGPSFLKWRETCPYFLFALLLCDVLPLFLRLVDARDVPLLCGVFLPCVFLPVAGLTSGLSLGKRQGFCPLYPLACALFYLPVVFLLFNPSALFHCGMVAVPALAGNISGAVLRRRREKM